MNTKHLDQSLFFAGPAGGTWRDAVWGAAVTDDTTGEIIATAVNPQPDQAWSMVGVRMNREFLATLRELAGVTDPLPADTARAELAYWRESVQFCVDRLMAPARRETKGEALMALHNVESYLRQLLELDGSRGVDGSDEAEERCYDCRTTEQRVSEVERLLKEMSNREQIDLRQFLGLAKQVDALEVKAASAAVHLGQVPNVVKRINELDHLVQAVIKDCVAIENRLEAQEERLASSEQHQDIMATYDRLALRKRAAGGT